MSPVSTRSRRGLRACRVATALTVLAVSASCSADRVVVVSEEAVEATAAAFTVANQVEGTAAQLPFPKGVVIPPARISSLSRRTGVSEDAFRTVAPQLHTQSVWQRAFQRTDRVYKATPEEVREPAINLVCEWQTGQITTEKKFQEAVTSEAISLGLSENKSLEFNYSISELRYELREAADGPDPNGDAAAVLFCFVLDQVID